MASICCNAETKIGYYNTQERPDIHGVQPQLGRSSAIGEMGTYCLKCGKLCDYVYDGVEYYTNGFKKQ